jgi:hypothetical protein
VKSGGAEVTLNGREKKTENRKTDGTELYLAARRGERASEGREEEKKTPHPWSRNKNKKKPTKMKKNNHTTTTQNTQRTTRNKNTHQQRHTTNK